VKFPFTLSNLRKRLFLVKNVKNVKFKNPGAAPLPTPMVTRRVESQALRVRIIYSFFESIQSLVTTTVESLLVIGFQAQVIVDSNEI